MRVNFSTVVTLLTSATPAVHAHYFFDVLVIDGVESKPIEYVRENTRAIKYMPTKFINTFDNLTPLSTDFRCNLGAGSGSATDVAKVAPGTPLAFKLAVGATMQHPGPAFVYMSKAPGDVKEYAGDGDWFKIHQEGICNDGPVTTTAWCTWDKDRISFQIPAGTPAGQYLVRVEHVGLHGAHAGEAEFFYACGQIEVTGNGAGVPGPTVKFPGAYQPKDAPWNFGVYGTDRDFPFPEPAVWTGGDSGSGSNATQPTPATTAPISSKSPVTSATSVTEASFSSQTPVSSQTPIVGGNNAGKPSKCSAKKHRKRAHVH
ncbi:unnamed protein product [Clonostachys byssicola]|uniref:lytic cellulose monooxygenase (C4-dehydrogenating) n=1 Tax=Clonostachys byssicola TaxID=160290 RepID=A0A9N9U3X7_9HYPO|nr:unnamed protein product [Clonostachys byssicola]